jgi:hypothetical protein|nr:MAG TPA: hypothetical protein [Caudoviricetes sp.]
MENILLVVIVGLFNLLSFILGATLGQNNVKVKNPVQQYRQYKEEKESNDIYIKEQRTLEQNLKNIDNYDGTSMGQEDFEN